MQPKVYDPLSYENLANSVVNALMGEEPAPLPPPEPFPGSGVYAIFYVGQFSPYLAASDSECKRPIYVGKAVPAGGRKGKSLEKEGTGNPLYARLIEHAVTIDQSHNLDVADFRCRFLVVVPVWISLAERFLISHYRPLWNVLLDGFGNHDPGRGRRNMRRPLWDIIHPGRPWAQRLKATSTPNELTEQIKAFFSSQAR